MTPNALIPPKKREQVRKALEKKDPKLLKPETKGREPSAEKLQMKKNTLLEAVRASEVELVREILDDQPMSLTVNEITQSLEEGMSALRPILDSVENDHATIPNITKHPKLMEIINMLASRVLEQRITSPQLDGLIQELREREII